VESQHKYIEAVLEKKKTLEKRLRTADSRHTLLEVAFKYKSQELAKIKANMDLTDAQNAAIQGLEWDLATVDRQLKHYKNESESAHLTADLGNNGMRDAQEEEYQPRIQQQPQQQQLKIQQLPANIKICQHWMEMGKCYGGPEGATCKNRYHPRRNTGAVKMAGVMEYEQL
jgi:hypothetical protein